MLRALRALAPSPGLSRALHRPAASVGPQWTGPSPGPWRGLADSHRQDYITKKAKGADVKSGLRVRRARAADTPRVLRFVREHARAAWPHASPPAPRDAVSLVIADYVARALAQGHSVLAEQAAGPRGWLSLRGLALGARVVPWDARLLERCARCVRCPRARRTLTFAAHCLRAPRLHDKYGVHAILQVLMIVPREQAAPALVRPLLQAALQRAKDQGIPLVRVDVTSHDIAKILEELQFKKEWYMEYKMLSDTIAEGEGCGGGRGGVEGGGKTHFVAVYSATTASTDTSAAPATTDTTATTTTTTAATTAKGPKAVTPVQTP